MLINLIKKANKLLTNCFFDYYDVRNFEVFKVAPRVEKTKTFKKVEILQVILVLRVTSWKMNFLLWGKERAFFSYLRHGIIFCSTELFECTVNFKFFQKIYFMLKHEHKSSKKQDLNFIRNNHLFREQK